MNVYDETTDTMQVSWEKVGGATGYMLLYKPTEGAELEKEVTYR